MKLKLLCLILSVLTVIPLAGCGDDRAVCTCYIAGFGSSEIYPLPDTELYIAGYKNGKSPDGILDLPQIRGIWLECGEKSMLLLSVDCIALDSGTVENIRSALKDFSNKTGCDEIHVFSTHTHASVDTLGLWGNVAQDGKNGLYMQAVYDSSVIAAESAYNDRRSGCFTYGKTDAGELQYDSREPQVYDSYLYQLRFIPDDKTPGIRILNFAAHAESLRGDNTLISRDYVGVLEDVICEKTSDRVMFLQGAIGGLIMTDEICDTDADAEANMRATGERLAELALGICEESVEDVLLLSKTVSARVPLDNALFLYYKFLGILGNKISSGGGETGYSIITTVTRITVGDVTLLCLPCEIFPELVCGDGLADGDPEPLAEIAADAGVEKLIVVNLCDDEIGYVIPPSAFMLNPTLPYIDTFRDETGENHYEETNSAGIETAGAVADAVKKLFLRSCH